jgi:hypothetical protein
MLDAMAEILAWVLAVGLVKGALWMFGYDLVIDIRRRS